jgi:hypothetical protein
MMSLRRMMILKLQNQKIGMKRRMVNGRHPRLITQSVREPLVVVNGRNQ